MLPVEESTVKYRINRRNIQEVLRAQAAFWGSIPIIPRILAVFGNMNSLHTACPSKYVRVRYHCLQVLPVLAVFLGNVLRILPILPVFRPSVLLFVLRAFAALLINNFKYSPYTRSMKHLVPGILVAYVHRLSKLSGREHWRC